MQHGVVRGDTVIEEQFWGQLFIAPREQCWGLSPPLSPPSPPPSPWQRSAPESRAELPEGDGEQRGIGRRFGSQQRDGWEQRAPAEGSTASSLFPFGFLVSFFSFFFFFSSFRCG